MDDEPTDWRDLLWENVKALMLDRYGQVNLQRLGREAEISTGGAQRLKAGASVGVDILARVAKCFEIETWQLLAPRLGEAMRLTDREREAVMKLRSPGQPSPTPFSRQSLPVSERPTGETKVDDTESEDEHFEGLRRAKRTRGQTPKEPQR